MLEVEGLLPLHLPSIIPGCGSGSLVGEKRVVGTGRSGGEACRQRVADGGGKARVSSRDTPGVESVSERLLTATNVFFVLRFPRMHIYVYMYPRLIQEKYHRDVRNSHRNCKSTAATHT